MRRGPAYHQADPFQKVLHAKGILSDYWHLLNDEKTLKQIDRMVVPCPIRTAGAALKKVSKYDQITYINGLTARPNSLARNERVLIASWPNPDAGVFLASYLAAVACFYDVERQHRYSTKMLPLAKLGTLKEIPDVLVLHSLDMDATDKRKEDCRDILDAVDDCLVLFVAVCESTVEVEKLLHRRFDNYIKVKVGTVI